ncbi:anaerobic ribonucleoside-triphosphate reductase activating protein [Agromyces atrinae]|uniref:Pyruvate formate lyase activating enzyme n=1 Tax=Agromyces atrinae TaxID=592376 RepID=A0A852S1U0_9MICO|nr:anaerobic ribonucleoside-triphosphate reductase activating protein [Agromyces atrinae]NYD66312.1 pyruvate formate lyase activating enzyme [Agromyces atrinae]
MTRRACVAADLRIAGLSKLSTVDWPDRLAATLFLQGCPWDCFYCHNPALIAPRAAGALPWEDVDAFLARRVGLLDAVVFSGGEPTMQAALLPALLATREYGFAVGLHSGGAYPANLSRVLPHVDWIGLDIKAEAVDYAAVTGRPGSAENAWRSLKLVLGAVAARASSERPLRYEVRTTVHASAFDEAGLARLGHRLADAGVTRWAVQRFRETGARSPLPRVAPRSGVVELSGLPRERFDSFTIR